MSYLNVDDCFASHPKVIALSHKAFRLHVTALCHCAQNLTDGHVTRQALRIVGSISGKAKSLTDELENAGLWEPAADGWVIHDYLDWNPSRYEVGVRKQVAQANARKRWQADAADTPETDASGNAIGIADGSAIGSADSSASGNAKPNALPSPPLTPRGLLSTPALNVGEDAHASGNGNDKITELILACGGSRDASAKISRTVKARKPSYETVARALDAARAPCRDPLAVALAILAPQRTRA